jgi:hypothetical protein
MKIWEDPQSEDVHKGFLRQTVLHHEGTHEMAGLVPGIGLKLAGNQGKEGKASLGCRSDIIAHLVRGAGW